MLALPAQSFKPPFAFLLLRKLILHEITIALSTFTCIKTNHFHLYCRARSLSSSILSLTLCSWSPTWKSFLRWKLFLSILEKSLFYMLGIIARWAYKVIVSSKLSISVYFYIFQIFFSYKICCWLSALVTSISALIFSQTGLFSRLLLPLSSLSFSSFSFLAFALTFNRRYTCLFVVVLTSSSLLLSTISSLSWAVRL